MLSAEHIKFHVFYAFPSCTPFEVETRHSSYEAVISRKRESFRMHERVGVRVQRFSCPTRSGGDGEKMTMILRTVILRRYRSRYG